MAKKKQMPDLGTNPIIKKTKWSGFMIKKEKIKEGNDTTTVITALVNNNTELFTHMMELQRLYGEKSIIEKQLKEKMVYARAFMAHTKANRVAYQHSPDIDVLTYSSGEKDKLDLKKVYKQLKSGLLGYLRDAFGKKAKLTALEVYDALLSLMASVEEDLTVNTPWEKLNPQKAK